LDEDTGGSINAHTFFFIATDMFTSPKEFTNPALFHKPHFSFNLLYIIFFSIWLRLDPAFSGSNLIPVSCRFGFGIARVGCFILMLRWNWLPQQTMFCPSCRFNVGAIYGAGERGKGLQNCIYDT